jgi:hypothetical protein
MVYSRHPRRLIHLLHNPEVNLALTHQNLVDHLANDIAALPDGIDIDERPIYHLVQRHAAWSLLAQGMGPQGQLQWELRLMHQGRDQTEVALRSPWASVGEASCKEAIP